MPKPAPRARLGPDERREQLLDAALALAAGGDVASVSVQRLARTAGVSQGLLYHYFPTKASLVAAAIRRAADALLTDLRQAAPEGAPVERLTAGLAAYLDHVEAQPTGWRAVLQARSGELADIGDDVETTSLGLIVDALDVESLSPVLHVALSGWLAFERAACLGWLDNQGLPRQALEDLLLSTFVETLTVSARHDDQARNALARLVGDEPARTADRPEPRRSVSRQRHRPPAKSSPAP